MGRIEQKKHLAWWDKSMILSVVIWRQEDHEFKARLQSKILSLQVPQKVRG